MVHAADHASTMTGFILWTTCFNEPAMNYVRSGFTVCFHPDQTRS